MIPQTPETLVILLNPEQTNENGSSSRKPKRNHKNRLVVIASGQRHKKEMSEHKLLNFLSFFLIYMESRIHQTKCISTF
jgi:hypothetical protein